MESKTFIQVAKDGDIPVGETRVFDLGGARVLVANVEGKYYAIDDTCTHDDGPLGEGTLEGCAVVCPRHGAKFDVRNGAVLAMPAAYPVNSYEVKVENGDIGILLEED